MSYISQIYNLDSKKSKPIQQLNPSKYFWSGMISPKTSHYYLIASNFKPYIFIVVWAETGEFRESNHNTMTSVTNMDHSQMNFQTPTSRNRRDRKPDGKSIIISMDLLWSTSYLCTYWSGTHRKWKEWDLQPKRGT